MRESAKVLIRLAIIAIISFSSSCSSITPIAGGRDIGVVLMHGKGGDTRWVDPLASDLSRAGVQVETPDMPWHRDRIYDKTFDESLVEIDHAVTRLREKGARRVFVAGHSLGAIAAAGYGAGREGLAGIILLAPGHFTSRFAGRFARDLSKAQSMIDSGGGSEYADFGDINMGKTTTRRLRANIYHSWFSSHGPAEFAKNMASIKPGTAVLYVVGNRDNNTLAKDRRYAFDRAPPHPMSKFLIISSDHLSTPADASEVVINWLREFK